MASTLRRLRQSMLFIGRFARGVYLYVVPVYRLTRSRSERASVIGLALTFMAARGIRAVGRLIAMQPLAALGRRLEDNTTFRMQGTTYFVHLRAGETFSFEEIYHNHTYDRAPGFVPRPGWVVFDVGANIGAFAVQQARRGARVIAFEPNPDCYRRLSRTVIANGLGNMIRPLNYAAGAAVGLGSLRMDDDVTCVGQVVAGESNASDPRHQTISITTLDDIVPALDVARIDLLKIDAEGAELDVLHGAAQTLTMVERIVLEYHSHDLREQVRVFLGAQGFVPVLEVGQGSGSELGIMYAERRS